MFKFIIWFVVLASCYCAIIDNQDYKSVPTGNAYNKTIDYRRGNQKNGDGIKLQKQADTPKLPQKLQNKGNSSSSAVSGYNNQVIVSISAPTPQKVEDSQTPTLNENSLDSPNEQKHLYQQQQQNQYYQTGDGEAADFAQPDDQSYGQIQQGQQNDNFDDGQMEDNSGELVQLQQQEQNQEQNGDQTEDGYDDQSGDGQDYEQDQEEDTRGNQYKPVNDFQLDYNNAEKQQDSSKNEQQLQQSKDNLQQQDGQQYYQQNPQPEPQPEPSPQPDPQPQIQDPNKIIINVSSVDELKKNFEKYKQQFIKDYSDDDEQIVFRFVIFTDNANKTNSHNENKNRTFRIHLNQYADKTLREFQSSYLMKGLGSEPPVKGIELIVPEKFDVIPIDWRERKATNRVKEQGQCGSCWAFAITAMLQSHLYIKKRQTLKNQLSQQQLVDCCQDAGFYCRGCDGAWPGQAMKYIAVEGIATARDYPYSGKDQYCIQGIETNLYLNTKSPYNQIKGTNQMLFALLSGPISAVVDSSLWQPLYHSGVFDLCQRPFDFNHAVVVIGVEQDGTWIVRNSWGVNWGESGHIRLPAGNSCGLTDWGIVPILQD